MKKQKIGYGNFFTPIGLGAFAEVGHVTTRKLTHQSDRQYLSIEVGEACQLQCKHCIYHSRKLETPRPRREHHENLLDALERGFDPLWISLAGKEPTIYAKDLIHLAASTKREDRLNIVMTNGLLLRGALLNDLADNIDYFDISLDGTKDAHDWMRGPGMFDKTWNNIEEVLATTDCKVGLIATAVKSSLNDDRPQYSDIVNLARLLEKRFGANDRISLSVSLYYGWPDDPMLLDAVEITGLAKGLSEVEFPTRILFTANYAHAFPSVARYFGISDHPLEFDVPTGIPLLRLGNMDFILFNLIQAPQVAIRLSNDGDVFLGCNHLVLGDDANGYRIASLDDEEFFEVTRRLKCESVPLMQQSLQLHQTCTSCEEFALCGGGDRLSGIYFNGRNEDPLCRNIN
jgi:radical SAM protein with 4Fe4S-binding SPASM domain